MSEPKKQPKILLHKPKKGQRSASVVDKGVSTSSKTPPSEPPLPNQPTWYRFRIVLTTLLVLNAVLVGYAIVRTSVKPNELLKEADSLEKKEREVEESLEEAESEKAEVVESKREAFELPESEAKSEKAEVVERKREILELPESEAKNEKAEVVDRKREPLDLPESETKSEKAKVSEETLELTESKASEIAKSKVQESPKVNLATALPPQQSVYINDRPKPSNEDQQELYKWMLAEKRKLRPTTKAEKAQIDAEKALLKDFLRRKAVLDF